MNPQRRQALLRGTSLAALYAAGVPALAQSTAAKATAGPAATLAPLAEKLRILIPANTGGGWDQTGRALGAALVATGAASQIEFENVGGKGGTIGLARYAEKYGSDPNTLLIGGVVMVGAVALQKPSIDLSHVQPLARLTSDYLVAAVSTKSPIRGVLELVDALRKDLPNMPIAGGSAGGVDHVFAGMLVRAAKANPDALVYRPFPGGSEVVDALVSGQAAIGISGYSEFKDAIDSGKLRAVGISARRSAMGLPSFREQNVDADMANWRAVFTGKDVPPARRAEMVAALNQAIGNAGWQRTLKQNHWESSWLTGKDFGDFLEMELITARIMMYLLKLKA